MCGLTKYSCKISPKTLAGVPGLQSNGNGKRRRDEPTGQIDQLACVRWYRSAEAQQQLDIFTFFFCHGVFSISPFVERLGQRFERGFLNHTLQSVHTHACIRMYEETPRCVCVV